MTTPDLALHPAAQPACKACGGRGVVIERSGELATAHRCACVGRCPACDDSGWVATADDWRAPQRRCSCQKLNLRITAFDAIKIPGRHANSTLDNYDVSVSRSASRAWMGARSVVSTWTPGRESRGFILHGPVGTGKTHLMTAVLRELVLTHGISARFVEFSHLIADLRSTFDTRNGGAGALLAELVDVDVLAIDELGKGRNTEWEGTVLDELVSRRYNAAATVLGTTNFEPGTSGNAVANAARAYATTPMLGDRVSDRVQSRLYELCDFLALPGTDWRTRRNRPPS